ncbi:MAG TPA: phage holin family protein [Candidatus Melainabacteria bacterium]|jgi:uncharacterized membrane protein YvlD (DUF360 family)|nr:phage holin family protein [Candidatus Melainabacteria bacterium]
MAAFILRILLNAVVLMYILPELNGISFHGEFWPQAVVAGFLFVLVAYVVRWLLAAFTVFTLGLGALYILFFFWMIPALQLMLMAHWFPTYLTIEGWGPAIIGGIIFMLINMITRNQISQMGGSRGDSK